MFGDVAAQVGAGCAALLGLAVITQVLASRQRQERERWRRWWYDVYRNRNTGGAK